MERRVGVALVMLLCLKNLSVRFCEKAFNYLLCMFRKEDKLIWVTKFRL